MRLTESDQAELKLDSYLMTIHNTHCMRCGSGEQYCSLHEVWTHPTKTRLSGFRDLRPAAGPLKDIHISYVDTPERQIPICSECIHTYQSATDKTPLPASTAQAWAETLKRKYQPEPKEVKIAQRSSSGGIPAPTPDEL